MIDPVDDDISKKFEEKVEINNSQNNNETEEDKATTVIFTETINLEDKIYDIQSTKYGQYEYFGYFFVADNFINFNLKNPLGYERYRIMVKTELSSISSFIIMSYSNSIILPTNIFNKSAIFDVTCEVILPYLDDVIDKKPTLSSDMLDYMTNNDNWKMIFETVEGKIEAMIPIMCSRSPVIDRMMHLPCKESTEKHVKIIDFSHQIVEKMIEFCHTDKIKDTKNCKKELAKIAEKYDINNLRTYIGSDIIHLIDHENFFEWFELACQCHIETVKNYCGSYASYWKTILFQNIAMENLDPEIASEFLKYLHKNSKSDVKF